MITPDFISTPAELEHWRGLSEFEQRRLIERAALLELAGATITSLDDVQRGERHVWS